jgi:hypothetical protein
MNLNVNVNFTQWGACPQAPLPSPLRGWVVVGICGGPNCWALAARRGNNLGDYQRHPSKWERLITPWLLLLLGGVGGWGRVFRAGI